MLPAAAVNIDAFLSCSVAAGVASQFEKAIPDLYPVFEGQNVYEIIDRAGLEMLSAAASRLNMIINHHVTGAAGLHRLSVAHK